MHRQQLPQDTVPTTGSSSSHVLTSLMLRYMEEHDLGAGALAVSKNGQIVYDQRFGWQDDVRTVPVRSDAIGRVASLSKPVTAAAVHVLVEQGLLGLDQPVFDLGRGMGVLKLVSWGEPDPRIKRVTVAHLLAHRGGWDSRTAGDMSFASRAVAEELGVPCPPSRRDMARWAMGQPLQFTPGASFAYSNLGYMLLGLCVEEASGLSFESALQKLVFEPLGVPANRIIIGQTDPLEHQPTEWSYDSNGHTCRNIMYPTHSDQLIVPSAFGGWDFAGHAAQGGVVTDAAALLALAAGRSVGKGPGIGAPRPPAGDWKAQHLGSHPGSNSAIWQRGDGVDLVVLFNRMPRGRGGHHGYEILQMVDEMLDRGELRLGVGEVPVTEPLKHTNPGQFWCGSTK